MRWFSDSQIAQGLTYLVSISASGDNGWFYSAEVPVGDRARCVEAVVSLFAQIFRPRCSAHLSHLSEVEAGSLNVVCYMWWDEFPCLALQGDPHAAFLHDTASRAMQKILGLRSLACEESALHGLGHWRRGHERRVESIIDHFVVTNPQTDPRLLAYAQSARCGCVL